ncbi:MAG: tRNA (guanosine(37)-N1)-methyltransferase TrmD [Deltaproteobacteria bacterium]|nr:tRNA (guanosine(37)-N1)-methyltransferase TrmD [Deltaproteobacteria bacterium]
MNLKRYDLLTIFPKSLDSYFASSLLGKASERGLIEVHLHDLRQFTDDKHRRVDDAPFGGGEGMVLKPEPLFKAIETLKAHYHKGITLYLSPQGKLFNQELAVSLANEYDQFLLICGRYEGVDERVIQTHVDLEISIGDFVLMGGELPAAMVVEALARLVPGVVGKSESLIEESHVNGLLEYAHYTRPEVFHGMEVPQVLLSGNHDAIRKWRLKDSLRRTLQKRPDLLSNRSLTTEEQKLLQEIKAKL